MCKVPLTLRGSEHITTNIPSPTLCNITLGEIFFSPLVRAQLSGSFSPPQTVSRLKTYPLTVLLGDLSMLGLTLLKSVPGPHYKDVS